MKKYKKSEAKLAKIIRLKSKSRIINCVVGAKESGKTFETKNILKKYIKKYPKDKVLILDYHNEYSEYRKIKPENIKRFRKPSRIVGHNSAINMFSILEVVASCFRGGLLVVDYPIHDLPSSKRWILDVLLSAPRTKDMDIILISQSLDVLSPRIYQNTNVFRVHKFINKEINLTRLSSDLIKIAVFTSSPSLINSTGHEFCYFDAVCQKVFGIDKQRIYFGVCEYYEPQIWDLTRKITTYGKH